MEILYKRDVRVVVDVSADSVGKVPNLPTERSAESMVLLGHKIGKLPTLRLVEIASAEGQRGVHLSENIANERAP